MVQQSFKELISITTALIFPVEGAYESGEPNPVNKLFKKRKSEPRP
jgi:hypothetical protein